jgi:hypothetical protein
MVFKEKRLLFSLWLCYIPFRNPRLSANAELKNDLYVADLLQRGIIKVEHGTVNAWSDHHAFVVQAIPVNIHAGASCHARRAEQVIGSLWLP